MYPKHAGDTVSSAVRYALLSTHAVIVCPFHCDEIVRVCDDAAESHAVMRARRLVSEQGTRFGADELLSEFERQLKEAADGFCPQCARVKGQAS